MYTFVVAMVKKYKVIGLMSGTSLDGLDIAYCEFEKKTTWKYKILHTETIEYSTKWRNKLSAAYTSNTNQVERISNEYAGFISNKVLKFIRNKKLNPDFISSHGHTVFHQPKKGITVQIGEGDVIASECKLPVVCDFRIGDVILGGQGAPLVPIADKLLFSDYTYCLNLGGFANISFNNSKSSRVAFDICPVNIVMNNLANAIGKEFDKDGHIAAKGAMDLKLLNLLNKLPFYKAKPPKSLGREWVEKVFMPPLNSYTISIEDKMNTICEHIAIQIGKALVGHSNLMRKNILITGGGAYNKYLIKRIKTHIQPKVVLPNNQTIQFKEAMAFAFLGVLRMRNEINILKSVTGARKDSSGGKIFRVD